MADKFCSEREAVEKIGISRPTIRKYRELGWLNPIQTRHTVLYSIDELEAFKKLFASMRKNSANNQ